jgi:hypothetical protein
MGADETIGDGEVEVVATETGSRRSGRQQENTRERRKGDTLNFLGDASHSEQEGWFRYTWRTYNGIQGETKPLLRLCVTVLASFPRSLHSWHEKKNSQGGRNRAEGMYG